MNFPDHDFLQNYDAKHFPDYDETLIVCPSCDSTTLECLDQNCAENDEGWTLTANMRCLTCGHRWVLTESSK